MTVDQILDTVLKVGTALAAMLAAWLSLQSRTHTAETRNLLLQTKMELMTFVDEKLKSFVPRAECDLAQRMASKEVEGLTDHIRSVDNQLRSVEQGLLRFTPPKGDL